MRVYLLSLLAACSSLPERPEVDICTVDIEHGQMHCCPASEDEENYSCYSLDLDDTDKYVATSPDDWAKIQLYIQKLQLKASKLMAELTEYRDAKD